MLVNDYYSKENHGDFEIFELGDFPLEEGGVIRDCKLAYRTHGTLNEEKDNAILITTWYSGTSGIMETVYVGDGRAIDPQKYFVIIVNQIGNGLSSSPHNTPIPFNGPRFPKVRIADDVRAQHKLITELFKLTSLELVMGGSMGGQQTYEWAVRFPEMVKRAAPIASTAKITPHNRLFSETAIESITSDPGWQNGWYTDGMNVHQGMRRHARLWGAMGFSTQLFKCEAWKEIGFGSVDDFTVGFLENYFLPMDPNNLISMAWKWQRADVSRQTGGDLAAALNRIKAIVFVMPIDEDMFFPPRDCQYECDMIPHSQFRPINCIWGHLGLFGMEPTYQQQVDQHLNDLLSLTNEHF